VPGRAAQQREVAGARSRGQPGWRGHRVAHKAWRPGFLTSGIHRLPQQLCSRLQLLRGGLRTRRVLSPLHGRTLCEGWVLGTNRGSACAVLHTPSLLRNAGRRPGAAKHKRQPGGHSPDSTTLPLPSSTFTTRASTCLPFSTAARAWRRKALRVAASSPASPSGWGPSCRATSAPADTAASSICSSRSTAATLAGASSESGMNPTGGQAGTHRQAWRCRRAINLRSPGTALPCNHVTTRSNRAAGSRGLTRQALVADKHAGSVGLPHRHRLHPTVQQPLRAVLRIPCPPLCLRLLTGTCRRRRRRLLQSL
jgi:hypothetical protein